jgi:hypothetical protein
MNWSAKAKAYRVSRNDSKLAWDVDAFLWARYDSRGNFIYPNIENWDDLLESTIEDGSYDRLSKDEVLSVLFGLHHRTRIVDGLWTSMFERGVMQKLLGRLLVLDADKY